MEENKDKDLYVIAVMRYKNANPNLNVDNLFSLDWNLCRDYKLKNNIISSALKNHILVEETKLYKEKFFKKIG